jgi:Flp pilus assembly protein TadD
VTLLGSNEKSAQMASSSVEAHNAYLQAHFHFQRRNVEDYRKAITYFDQAIQLDPNYALAYAERAEVWTMIGDLTGERATAYPKARSDAEKAVEIAPGLAEAHAALGWVRFFGEWKFGEGLTELNRAKELSPANPTANDLLARMIVYLGRIDEAERQARQAVELDPLSVATQFNLARVLFCAGKLDEADAAGRKIVELQPSSSSSHRWQVLVAVQHGEGETALREAQLEPDDGFRPFELALAYHVPVTARQRTRLWPSSWPIAKMGWPIKSPKRTPCEARQTKLSNGCKSLLIITTAGRLALPSTHYCVACTTIAATRTCSPNSVYPDRHERKASLFRGDCVGSRLEMLRLRP